MSKSIERTKLPDSPFLSVQRVCEILGLTKERDGRTVYLRHTIDDAISSGRLRAVCIGRGQRNRKLIIDPRDLAKFLEENRLKPSGRKHGVR